ncbi:MAG TPA: ATP-binding protein [Terracidiphilus sp.]|jgi:anti-sigma regulatory factor (Ser/Thr protein kinase)|nr:ATP-binding protein [Terracidiphilus sp.]
MDNPQDRLELDSQLTELSRVQPWIEAVADRHGVAEDIRFAMQLCMEEALANVVLHGYHSEPGHPIVLKTSVSAGTLFFTIDDQAPPFSPIEPGWRDDRTKPASLASIQPGGNGLRLLRHFGGSLSYERLADGNRLTIGFAVPMKNASI